MPLSCVVRDPHRTDPTQERCDTVDHAESHRLPPGNMRLGNTYHTDQKRLFPEKSRSTSGNRSYRSSVRCADDALPSRRREGVYVAIGGGGGEPGKPSRTRLPGSTTSLKMWATSLSESGGTKQAASQNEHTHGGPVGPAVVTAWLMVPLRGVR